jgi:hypothetical protein
MKLDAVVRNRAALLEMERYVDGDAKSYSVLAARTEAATRYRPESWCRQRGGRRRRLTLAGRNQLCNESNDAAAVSAGWVITKSIAAAAAR